VGLKVDAIQGLSLLIRIEAPILHEDSRAAAARWARFTIDVSSTIIKKAAPVATAGIQLAKGFAEHGFDPDSVTLSSAEPSRATAFTVSLQDHP